MIGVKLERISEYLDTPIPLLRKLYSRNDLTHEAVELALVERWTRIRNLFRGADGKLRTLTEREWRFQFAAHAIACVMQDDYADCPMIREGLSIRFVDKCEYCVNKHAIQRVSGIHLAGSLIEVGRSAMSKPEALKGVKHRTFE